MPPSIVKGKQTENANRFGFSSRPASKEKPTGIAKPKTSYYNTQSE